MSKNSTIKLLELLLNEKYSSFDRSVHKILSTGKLEPRREIINKIIAYASTVRGIKMKSDDKILISLN